MGLHDRPYWQEEHGHAGRGLSFGLPRPSPTVRTLLILNFGAFLAQLVFLLGLKVSLSEYLGVTAGGFWQVWRYVTFQFLHNPGSIWHIALNMLGLYMLGSPLEQLWGRRRFLRFYLSCGVAAGLAYVVMAGVFRIDNPLVGASGGVYGLMLACAVHFPGFRLILLFFPVPIRLAALLLFGGMLLYVLTSLSSGQVLYNPEFWSHVAHLGGAVTAAVWLWVLPRLGRLRTGAAGRINRGAWERKMNRRAEEQAEIDRILAKIHDEGVASLSARERKTLRQATRRQQEEDKRLRRM